MTWKLTVKDGAMVLVMGGVMVMVLVTAKAEGGATVKVTVMVTLPKAAADTLAMVAAAADHRALGPSEPFFGGLTLQGRLPATGFSVFELAVRFGRLVSIRNTTRENKHIVSSSENCFRHVEFMTGLVFYLWLLM